MIRFLILLFIWTFSLFADSTFQLKGQYSIVDFSPEDFSRNTFVGSIQATDNEESKKFFSLDQSEKPRILIGDIQTELLKESIHTDNGLWHFRLVAYNDTKPEKYPIKLISVSSHGTEKELHTFESKLPSRNAEKNKQPLVLKLEPSGGTLGDSININGNFFGNSVEQIVIHILDPKGDKADAFGEKRLTWFIPTHLYTDPVKNTDQIRFTVSSLITSKIPENEWTFIESIFGKKLQLKIISNYRASNIVNLYLLKQQWQWKIASIATSLTLILLFLIYLILRKNFFRLLIDSSTQTYSLAKFQGFIWTIVLLASYIYVALCKKIILESEALADFNPSLLLLLGISYGGMFTSLYLQNQKEDNSTTDKKPEWKDLFQNNGEVDLSKIQLFLFTIVAVFLYLFNLIGANVLLGLPDIPNTLHGLLTASQAGYLSGKMLTSNLNITYIHPNTMSLENPPKEFSIFGSGFSDGMKVIIEGSSPVKSELISPNEIKIRIPKELPQLGKKKIILIPQTGNPAQFKGKIDVIE